MKHDPEGVLAALHIFLHVHAPGAEHVASLQHLRIVHEDLGVSVQSIEYQFHVLLAHGCGIGLELRLVFPIGKADPLQFGFIVAIERFGDELIGEKVGLHYTWYRRRVPIFCRGQRWIAKRPELPAIADRACADCRL